MGGHAFKIIVCNEFPPYDTRSTSFTPADDTNKTKRLSYMKFLSVFVQLQLIFLSLANNWIKTLWYEQWHFTVDKLHHGGVYCRIKDGTFDRPPLTPSGKVTVIPI